MTPVITVINTIANLLSCMEESRQHQLARRERVALQRGHSSPPASPHTSMSLERLRSSKGMGRIPMGRRSEAGGAVKSVARG